MVHRFELHGMEKLIVDWILGVRAVDGGLVIDPVIPAEWDGFKIKRLLRLQF